jgi:hypothetical protein
MPKIMKACLLITTLCFTLISISCKKESNFTQLQGQWVRADNRSDTITFRFEENINFFILNRGYQVGTDGISRPINPFGIYEYKVQANSILMRWWASSYSGWPSYNFSLSGSVFEIGDFIEHTNTKIQFEKLK